MAVLYTVTFACSISDSFSRFSNFIAVEEVRMAGPVPVCTTTCTICLSVQLFVVIFGHIHACTSGFSDPEDFRKEGAQYLPLQTGSSNGLQVIIPEMKFNCHGYVTSWSALTALDSKFEILTHHINFQIWRPIPDGKYQFVGEDYLLFLAPEIQGNVDTETPTEEDIGFFQFENKIGVELENRTSRVYFRPNDVLGYFIRTEGSIVPLSIVFRNATSSDDASTVVHLFSYTYSSNQQFCEASTCGEAVMSHLDVVPQISVNFETVPASVTPDFPRGECISTSVEACPVPSPTLILLSSPGEDVETEGRSNIIPIVVPVVVGVSLAVALILARCKKQKTSGSTVLERPQGTVLESNEPFAMIRNDAYTAVIATERNEAYMTNADIIPPSQNEAGEEPFEMTGNAAYTVVTTTERNEAYVTNIDIIPAARNMAYVATELEGGNSLNREDMNDGSHPEPQAQTTQDQGMDDYSYVYVH